MMSPRERDAQADRIAQPAGLVRQSVVTPRFTLTSYHRLTAPGEPVSVYVEGDGLAWISRRRLSSDPTPLNPVALRLATRDPAPNVVYLARPCQFVPETRQVCDSDYWSTRRFAPEVIAAMGKALDQLLGEPSGKRLRLVGYSGGAAVAALLAATRTDVIDLRTIAGNLDTATFTRVHGVTPLAGSLNPADHAVRLAHIPQLHLLGDDDAVITPAVMAGYLQRLRRIDHRLRCVRVITLAKTSHGGPWGAVWQRYLSRRSSCDGSTDGREISAAPAD